MRYLPIQWAHQTNKNFPPSEAWHNSRVRSLCRTGWWNASGKIIYVQFIALPPPTSVSESSIGHHVTVTLHAKFRRRSSRESLSSFFFFVNKPGNRFLLLVRRLYRGCFLALHPAILLQSSSYLGTRFSVWNRKFLRCEHTGKQFATLWKSV